MKDAELGRKVKEVQEKYGHLLTTEAALSVVRTGGAGGNGFKARILRVFRPYEFEKSGRKGKVCRVELERLDTREKPILVIWDADVDRLLKGELEVEDVVEVLNSYAKEGELHLGRRGSMKLFGKAGSREADEVKREAGSKKLGIVRELQAKGNALEALVELNGKQERMKFKGKHALALLGIRQMHEGISLKTLVKLKKSHLIGKTVPL